MTVDEKLAELGIVLPQPSAPLASYVMARRTGNLVRCSGHLGKRDSVPVVGAVGGEVSREDARDAARAAAIEMLATLRSTLASLDEVRSVAKLTGFVRSAPDFTEQPFVVNGASDLFVDVFGDAGRHARSAVGVAQLPLGAAVEIDAIFEVR